jgi:hypothetical protein
MTVATRRQQNRQKKPVLFEVPSSRQRERHRLADGAVPRPPATLSGSQDLPLTAPLFRVRQDLRPVFEVHGIVVIPFAAPDEAVLLEDADDLPGHLVPVGNVTVGFRL